MANSVITLKAREKMVKARAGIQPLPAIVGMAFGDGGVDSSQTLVGGTLFLPCGGEDKSGRF